MLEKKSIIITGAAGGLGVAVAKECLASGAYLTLVDNNKARMDEVVRELRQAYPEAGILQVIADVTQEQDVRGYVARAVAQYGRIDGLYNNAGIEGKLAPIIEYDVDIFKKMIEVNLLGVYYGLRYVLPVMVKQGWGRIVNVSSVGGMRAVMNHLPYIATKHAVEGMTKNAALEYGRYGILTNAIAPGLIRTPMAVEAFRQLNPVDPEQAENNFAVGNPLKRLGNPDEVADLVVFLLSGKCRYINGQIIAIDGGEANSYGPV